MIRMKPAPQGLRVLAMHGVPAEVWVAQVPAGYSVEGKPADWTLYLYGTEDAMRSALERFRESLGAVAPWLGFSPRAVRLENLRKIRPWLDSGRVAVWVWGA